MIQQAYLIFVLSAFASFFGVLMTVSLWCNAAPKASKTDAALQSEPAPAPFEFDRAA